MTIKWHKQIIYDSETIRFMNPVPDLVESLIKLLPSNTITSDLNTIVTELYNNSVDHGLLDLSSSIKEMNDGFNLYYSIREKKLSQLDNGYVAFDFTYEPREDLLKIEISDSGSGFDFAGYMVQPLVLTKLSGRGLYLIDILAEHLSYTPHTNTVKVEYKCERASRSNYHNQQSTKAHSAYVA